MTTRRAHFFNKQQLATAEVLFVGIQIPIEWETTWRDNVTVEHVFWLHTFDGHKVACVQMPSGSYREVSLLLCQRIWPNVRIQQVAPLNRRVIKNGHTIPVIPDLFYQQKISNANKQRASRARKRSNDNETKTTVVQWDRPPPPPHVSLYHPPLGFFTAVRSPTAAIEQVDPRPLAAMLQRAISLGRLHPDGDFLSRDEYGLGRIRSESDLASHPFSRLMLQIFSFFSPLWPPVWPTTPVLGAASSPPTASPAESTVPT